jgi:hypothetical protein
MLKGELHRPFYDPGLEELVSRGVEGEKLSFVSSEGLAKLIEENPDCRLASVALVPLSSHFDLCPSPTPC